MLPMFNDDERRRKRMNLGGAASVASHQQVLQNARHVREQRAQQRQKEDCALLVQSCWRGYLSRQDLKKDLRERFDRDVQSVNALRCLCWLKQDTQRLAVWAATLASNPQLLETYRSSDDDWLEHLSTLAIRMLSFLPIDPQASLSYLNIILSLLQVPEKQHFAQSFLEHGFYSLIRGAILSIPIASRNSSPLLPLLSDSLTILLPFFPRDSPQYRICVLQILTQVLSIPLLVNRLPLKSLTSFSAKAPLVDITLLEQADIQTIANLEKVDRTHLLANLTTLMPPRYKKLSAQSFEVYFAILRNLLVGLPSSVFEVPKEESAKSATHAMQNALAQADGSDSDSDSDMDVGEGLIAGPSNGLPVSPSRSKTKALEAAFLNAIDSKTRTRLRAIASIKHLSSLFSATGTQQRQTRNDLYGFLVVLIGVWDQNREDVLTSVLSHTGGGIIREIYRNEVRGSVLGKEVDTGDDSASGGLRGAEKVFKDSENAGTWLLLLFLVDLFAHALVTMGDDEFFASRGGARMPSASDGYVLGSSSTSTYGVMAGQMSTQRNPLTIDEVITFSRQLMNIAFTLYMNEGLVNSSNMGELAPGTGLAWESVREKVTKLLQAIHARDSRRPFTPPDHWLFSSQIDMNSFVEAAVIDDSQISSSALAQYLYPQQSSRLSRRRLHSGRSIPTTTTKRVLAHLSPRLGVLNNIPFAIPFETRVKIFRQFVHRDEMNPQGWSRERPRWMGASSNNINPNPSQTPAGAGAQTEEEEEEMEEEMEEERDTPFIPPPRLGSFLPAAYLRLASMLPDLEDMQREGDDGDDGDGGRNGVWDRGGTSTVRVTIRRDRVAQDGFDRLNGINLKRPLQITFVDQWGNEEAGIDGGGVFKEFFTSLSKEVFDTNRGLWLATKQNELYPNPHSYAKEPYNLEWYRFIGRIMGRALYQGILIDVAFAGFFLSKWLGRQSYLDDLASLDPELYRNLLFLKDYTGNFEDLSLTFAVVEDDLGVSRTVDLIQDGANVPVTHANRLKYIILMSHYRLTRQIRAQSDAFFEGLSELIEPKWIRMFNQQELQILIGGVDKPVDLEDLRRNTNYGGAYEDDDPVIRAFWSVVEGFSHEQRRALLRFATSCSRPPLLGFKELNPKFGIRDAGTDQERLPTASTCFNLLKLPRYTSETVMRAKLLQAIMSGAGFDLS